MKFYSSIFRLLHIFYSSRSLALVEQLEPLGACFELEQQKKAGSELPVPTCNLHIYETIHAKQLCICVCLLQQML